MNLILSTQSQVPNLTTEFYAFNLFIFFNVLILQLTAVDKDMGENGVVEYFLVEGDNSMFSMRRETGEIVTRRMLSVVDNSQQHRLVVEARDKGLPRFPLQNNVNFINLIDFHTRLCLGKTE